MLMFDPIPQRQAVERFVRRYSSNDPESWDVIDTLLDRRIACVRGFRVIWEEWYEDVWATVFERDAQGMTAAAAIRGTYSERNERNQQKAREKERGRAILEHRPPAEWAALRRPSRRTNIA